MINERKVDDRLQRTVLVDLEMSVPVLTNIDGLLLERKDIIGVVEKSESLKKELVVLRIVIMISLQASTERVMTPSGRYQMEFVQLHRNEKSPIDRDL